jgi:hypothetical protein
MKGLASLLIAGILTSVAALAGPLEMTLGVGPSAAALGTLNDSIGVVNTLIGHLNDTFDVHPDVSGSIDLLDPMGSGMSLHAGERLWLTDWLGLGAGLSYFSTATATAGFYEGSETSTIDIALDMQSVGVTLGGRATFLDVGLRLAADVAAGYYYLICDRAVTFEVPSEYPDVLSNVPPEGEGRYTGSTFGFEIGFSISYPILRWFTIGSTVSYRATGQTATVDTTGTELDLTGDEEPDSIDLNGVTVRLAFSINIDLSPDGEKE